MKTPLLLLGTSLALSLTLAAASAQACGYCIEDKIAAVYDHAVVSKALAGGGQIAFFAVQGDAAGSDAEAIKAAVESVKGVQRNSARFSASSASLSLAFDPKRISYVKLVQALESKLQERKLILLPLRIMDKPATLEMPKT